MEQTPTTMQQIKVLIVDDEEAMRNALADTFQNAGAGQIITAQDGQEGLEKALAEHPDLILLDILMPKMDGIAMLKKLRENEWGSSVKAIVLTNFDTTDEMLKEVTITEPSFYLLKSNWGVEDVLIKAKEVLGLL